jgi:hypothetical protein
MYIYKRTLIIQVSVALSYKVTIGNIAQQTQQREPQLDLKCPNTEMTTIKPVARLIPLMSCHTPSIILTILK